MSKWNALLLSGVVAACVSTASVFECSAADKAPALNYKVKNIAGKEVNLADQYKGKVVLVVNVASQCGNTKQYKQLEELHEKYSDKGLAVTGFPCNQFGGQEPGSEAEIAEFCSNKYGVKFDLFSKLNVNPVEKGGKVVEEADPFFKNLTSTETTPIKAGKVSWNFEKFLIGKNGQVVARFSPSTKPDAPEVVKAIEAELAK